MNLYRLGFTHHAPKGSASGTVSFFIAKDVEELLEKIDSITCWGYYFQEEAKKYYINEEYMTFKEALMIKEGDSFVVDFLKESDLHYGFSEYSWEVIKEGVTDKEVSFLKSIGIINK